MFLLILIPDFIPADSHYHSYLDYSYYDNSHQLIPESTIIINYSYSNNEITSY